jgi:hypothetical protein
VAKIEAFYETITIFGSTRLAAMHCGRACPTVEGISIFEEAMPPQIFSPAKAGYDTLNESVNGQASLTAVHCGKPQRVCTY